MTMKFSHLNLLFHHEIFPQFKTKKKGDVSRSDYLQTALTGEYRSLKNVLQGSPNQDFPLTVFCSNTSVFHTVPSRSHTK